MSQLFYRKTFKCEVPGNLSIKVLTAACPRKYSRAVSKTKAGNWRVKFYLRADRDRFFAAYKSIGAKNV